MEKMYPVHFLAGNWCNTLLFYILYPDDRIKSYVLAMPHCLSLGLTAAWIYRIPFTFYDIF